MSERPKIVELPPCGLANDNRQIAVLLRDLADGIERGDWSGVDNVVVVIDGPQIVHEVYGKPCNRAQVVGVLTYAVHNIMSGKG